MSQNTLKVNELHEDADFDENSTETEIFDEKAGDAANLLI